MRAPLIRGAFDADELVIDNFAGGGGASTGIEEALGRPVDIAINHSAEAIAMHQANHPNTRHYCEDIWTVDPREACAGRRVGLAWFSPDCTHFSRAKGCTPLKKEIRALADVVVRWAREVRPRVILLENVEEFQTWGPLLETGRPDPARAGADFRAWLAALTGLGYSIDFRVLVAADYGTPTTRKRLFLVARCDGGGISWPAPSHGRGRAAPHRPASEIIDWSLPCPSIFERRRPLAEATERRIALGLQRYVFGAAAPFIMPVKTWGGGGNGPRSVEDPMRTVTASKRGEFAMVEPFLARTAHGDVDSKGKRRGRGQHSLGDPLPTVTASKDFAVVEPFVVRHGHYSTITGAGLREGCGAGTFRGQPLAAPLGTVCATNDKHLVLPLVTKHYGGVVGHGVQRPIGTVTGRDHHALTAAFVTKYYGTGVGSDVQLPLPTVMSGGGHGGGHLAEVRAFLVKYYGEGSQGQQLSTPLHTATAKARFGLVTVRGEDYELVDIGMRMLQPHELFAAQGFPAEYEIAPVFRGKPLTKTAQTELAGNSVCPQVAEALVVENLLRAA